MRMLLAALLGLSATALALEPCGNTPAYTPCDIAFELDAAAARSAELWAEFRSPEYKTYRVAAFRDGGRKMVFRINPVLAGEWTYRISGNVAGLDGKIDKFTAVAAPQAAAFIQRANVHHWQYTEGRVPHLYMGADYQPEMPVEAYAAAKFTHLAVPVLAAGAYADAGTPEAGYFQRLDGVVAAIHARGITADLILAGTPEELVKAFPGWRERQKFLEYVVARYAAFNITWQLAGVWEAGRDGKAVLKEAGLEIKKLDPYGHPRSARSRDTSSALGPDGWMDHVIYGTQHDELIAVEHQLNTVPQVALIDGTLPPDVFRKRLWNATMSGAYPVMTGKAAPESANGKVMTAWFTFFSTRVRHWDTEPYFDVEGGRSIAIPGVRNDDYDIGSVEYIVYVEHPQKVTVTVQKHGYNVYWVNPSTGEMTKEKKEWKGELYEGTGPNAERDWVLHLSRDEHKEGMLKGGVFSGQVKFESWPVPVQEPERSAQKAPFELAQPTINDTLVAGQPVKYQIKLKRQTGGTRRMTYVITGEAVRDGQGTRLLGCGAEGTFTVEPGVLTGGAGVLNVRLAALNAPGKLYLLDYVFPVKGRE